MRLHQLVDLGDRIARGMPLPRHALPGIQHRDIGLRPARHRDQLGHLARRLLRHQPASQLVRIGDRRRQPDRLQAGHDGAQPRQPERQQMAALRRHQRMQLVEDDVAQILEEALRVRRRDQQRKLLGRGEQYVGRRRASGAGACARACRRCASPASPAGPSPRPAWSGCARCRRPAPSAARCRACGCRAAPRRACASAGRPDRSASA